MQKLTVTSKVFSNEGMIPSKYTGDGDDISPQLSWQGTPPGTVSFALICDDPDAPGGNWDHWILFNIPGDTAGLEEDFRLQGSNLRGVKGGTNDFGEQGYGGPYPPSGIHRYFFRVYALDTMLNAPLGARKAEVLRAMKGHVLAEGQIMGRYARHR
jgi:Raf kinase inhibitor-like YbhB/YbcL family protein